MESLYNITLYIACTLLSGIVSIWTYIYFIAQENTSNLQACDGESASSFKSLPEELENELKQATHRYKLHKCAYYLLSSFSIVGSIMVSTVYFQETFHKQVGLMGFLILISTILTLLYRPIEKYRSAIEDVAFLKKAKRDYQSNTDTLKANTLLRKRLAEYDLRHCHVDL